MKFTMRLLLLITFVACTALTANAQYFGKNKPTYEKFDFYVLQTPAFEINSCLKNQNALQRFANDAEHWYFLHKSILLDSFEHKPILLYNDQGDYQMRTTLSGQIGTESSSVKASLKKQMVMPLTFSNEQTSHVLAHEMVHLFQYHLIKTGPKKWSRSMSRVPLWMVEGLAEYMSIGRVDAHTAIWMRDAVLNSDVPSIKELNSAKYFSYRYGQALWAYLAGTYGDDIIRPFFMETARYGLDDAIKTLFGITREEMSQQFVRAMQNHYGSILGDHNENANTIGRKIISGENSGTLHFSPAMSPDGKYILYFSERNLFTTDLDLNSTTGTEPRHLARITRDGHLDDLSFIESAGTWSNDSEQFAFIDFRKGKNVLVIENIHSVNTKQIIEIEGVQELSNPAWSPNNENIVFTGLVEGQTDLFKYNLLTKEVEQLTNNIYSEIQPNFNADGIHIVYATDELSIEEGRTHGRYLMNLAVMDITTQEYEHLSIFKGADNLNPSFDHEGNIIFLSDRDGFRNMYKYDAQSDGVIQMTKLLTGITGLTKYSPAISVSRQSDLLVYTHYYRGDYVIYQSSASELLKVQVDKNDINFFAATLPVTSDTSTNILESNLTLLGQFPSMEYTEKSEYKPKLRLDRFSGSEGVGVGTGATGTRVGLAGGIEAIVNDLTGIHELSATLAINGGLQDIGGQIGYLNRKHRIAYGGRISHVPQRYFVGTNYSNDTIDDGGIDVPTEKVENLILKIFEENASFIAELPLNKNIRIESNIGVTYRFYKSKLYTDYYSEGGNLIMKSGPETIPIEGDEYDLGYYIVRKGAFYNISGALVGDNAQFGMTSPMHGYRYRLELTQYFGTYNFTNTNIDLRLYEFLGPVSIAMRFQHGARHGPDANSYNPTYIGWQGFVHGYEYKNLERLVAQNDYGDDDSNFRSDVTVEYRRLSGSKYFLSGFEIRMPLSGPERLAHIKSNFIMTDLSFFFDIGAAFDKWEDFNTGEEIILNRPDGLVTEFHKPRIASSIGFSLRANIFNAIIVEPYIALPLTKNSTVLFGFNLIPGW